MRVFSFECVFSLNWCCSQRQTTNIWITWTHPIKKEGKKKAPLAHMRAAIKLAFINHRLILKGIDRLNVLRAFEF